MKNLYISMFGLKLVNKAIEFKNFIDGQSIELGCDCGCCGDHYTDKKSVLMYNMATNIEWNKPALDLKTIYLF